MKLEFKSEKDLENYFVEKFNKDKYFAPADEEYIECHQQFDTKGYGVCDLVFTGAYPLDEDCKVIENYISVVELKNKPIRLSDIAQLCRYRTYFERAIGSNDNVSISYYLVVPKGILNNTDCVMTLNALSGIITAVEFSVDADSGMSFSRFEGGSVVNEDLSQALSIIQ